MTVRKLAMTGEIQKGAKIHDLVKAPANTPWAIEKQQSWDETSQQRFTTLQKCDENPARLLQSFFELRDAIGGGRADAHFVDTSTTQEMMSQMKTYTLNGNMQKRN